MEKSGNFVLKFLWEPCLVLANDHKLTGIDFDWLRVTPKIISIAPESVGLTLMDTNRQWLTKSIKETQRKAAGNNVVSAIKAPRMCRLQWCRSKSFI